MLISHPHRVLIFDEVDDYPADFVRPQRNTIPKGETMFLREKGSDGEPVHMDWDQAQSALQTGRYEIVSESGGENEVRSEKIVPDLPDAARVTVASTVNVRVDGPDYDAMSRAELDALAADRGVDVAHAKNKGEVIEALRRAS